MSGHHPFSDLHKDEIDARLRQAAVLAAVEAQHLAENGYGELSPYDVLVDITDLALEQADEQLPDDTNLLDLAKFMANWFGGFAKTYEAIIGDSFSYKAEAQAADHSKIASQISEDDGEID